MKLQSFIEGMAAGIVVGVLAASASQGKLGKGFVRRVLNLRDTLNEVSHSAEEEISGKLSQVRAEEERDVRERLTR